MPLHLLGICREEDRLPRAEPRCSEIRWVVDGRLAAATVPPPSATSGPLEHAAWLAAIHAHISILPARYGTVLPDEDAVRHFLANRGDDLLHDLAGVEGAGEIGLRIEIAAPAALAFSQNQNDNRLPPATPGQYLAMRRQRYEWRDRLDRQGQLVAKRFVQALHGLYRKQRTLPSTLPSIVRLAFLVPRDLWDACRERLQATMPNVAYQKCTLLGPWPPYSFA